MHHLLMRPYYRCVSLDKGKITPTSPSVELLTIQRAKVSQIEEESQQFTFTYLTFLSYLFSRICFVARKDKDDGNKVMNKHLALVIFGKQGCHSEIVQW